MKNLMVLTPIDMHMPGQVISISPDDEKKGVSVERLVALGAAREATGDEAASAVLYGTNDPDRYLQPIPQVEPKLEAVKRPVGKPDFSGGKE